MPLCIKSAPIPVIRYVSEGKYVRSLDWFACTHCPLGMNACARTNAHARISARIFVCHCDIVVKQSAATHCLCCFLRMNEWMHAIRCDLYVIHTHTRTTCRWICMQSLFSGWFYTSSITKQTLTFRSWRRVLAAALLCVWVCNVHEFGLNRIELFLFCWLRWCGGVVWPLSNWAHDNNRHFAHKNHWCDMLDACGHKRF